MAKSLEELFLEKAKEELERQAEDLIMGSADDYPSYREKVGYAKGMMFCVDIFQDLIKRARKENLDD